MSAIVKCSLCPKECELDNGESGDCRIRINIDGKLTATTFGFPSAVHTDPIEKKPLYHFLPGTKAFSIGTVGCNLHCLNCQNWEISQCNPEDSSAYALPPESVVESALKYKVPSIAYTYSEPVVSYEYTFETAKIAKEKGLKNLLITAGYINKKPLKELLPFIDAANINLKAMSNDFYRKICGATLRPVLDAIVCTAESDTILEVTNLIIPGLNDKDNQIRELVKWVKSNLGTEIPLHFLKFFPQYKMKNLPHTPQKLLEKAYDIAKDEGLAFVYIGNLVSEKGQNTLCPCCGRLLVTRAVFSTEKNDITNSKCPSCGKKIYGLWE
ncbi:MAG TPA: AmmeMemoRadiSam system radical SAM enzyme [Victivallales bacterium]|nr:AmmeMemoRadiSam system radical SAM enzyme [Victivallales bacterium]